MLILHMMALDSTGNDRHVRSHKSLAHDLE